jgi:2-furoate---CoA ligase
MVLRHILEFAASRYPEDPAILDGAQRYSYGAWDERVNAVANALAELGVRRGHHVVQVLKNREETCAVHLACQKLGAITTPLNFRWSREEIEFCVNEAEPDVVAFEAATSEPVMSVYDRLSCEPRLLYVGSDVPDGAHSFDAATDAASRVAPRNIVDESDIALMLYTSGTAGQPKGVLRSQRAEYEATIAHIVYQSMQRHERTLGAMPLFHTMGLRSLTAMLTVNGLFIPLPVWETDQALRIIQREQVTYLHLVPTLFHELVTRLASERYDTSSVRKLGYAGAAMDRSLVEACIERFQPTVFVNHYGSTEAAAVSVYTDPRKKPGCAGRAAYYTQVRIVSPDPEPVVRPDDVVPSGEIGEVIVRLSGATFTGYHNRPEDGARAVRDGWYFTGDTGYLDGDGDLWICGRLDGMIITGGENVHPVEVERELSGHPDVQEVAVAGTPDKRWGQVVTAFIVPKRRDLAEADIDAYCRDSTSLAQFKRPRKVVFVERIPKSAAGKVERHLLVEDVGKDTASGGA